MEYKLKEFQNDLNVTRIANVHYFEFGRHYRTHRNAHAFRELVYVDSGIIKVDAETYTGVLVKNQILIHRPQEGHSLTCGSEDTTNVVIIGFECEAPELDLFSSTPFSLNDMQLRHLTDVVKEGRCVFMPPYDVPDTADMKKRDKYPFGADQMIRLKLETLLIELIRCTVDVSEADRVMPEQSYLREVHAYIENNFREKLTLGELSFLFSTNKTSLCRDFKDVYGCSIIHYISTLRVKEAKRLMREGKDSMTQISSKAGFSSIHYFSKVFKKMTGQTPSEYSKTIKCRLEM